MENLEMEVRKLSTQIGNLKSRIEKDELLLRKYWNLINTLNALNSILANEPIDVQALIGEAAGIIRMYDGPLYNEIEQEAYELAGEVGLLVRKLKGKQGGNSHDRHI